MKLEGRNNYKYQRYGGKFTTVHRVVMHEVDPRENEHELVVHHIDGDKANNVPNNLMWMTPEEHSRLHHIGENHFPCDGQNNANYKHGMCVGGVSKEYRQIHNHKTYMKHRERRLAKQNAYGAEHREHKRWYDKMRHWTKQLELATTDERRNECRRKIEFLQESAV